MKKMCLFMIGAVLAASSPGCAILDKADMYDVVKVENHALKKKLEELKKQNADKDAQITNLLKEKEEEIETIEEKTIQKLSELEQAKLDLERALKEELNEYKTKLEMTERGLVLTFLAEIFFDSGRDVIREAAKPSLEKVAKVLNDQAVQSYVAVEGYTDNVPITRSGWKSNWELSSARALAVVHYFIDQQNVDPRRLSAVGYGEFRPVTTNDTPEGRQQNRRVEIVILPAHLEKDR